MGNGTNGGDLKQIKACRELKLSQERIIREHNPFSEGISPENDKVVEFQKAIKVWLALDLEEEKLLKPLIEKVK